MSARVKLVRTEDGNAPVEFVGWTAVLVVPVVYLVIALAAVQAAAFGTESAADAAARVLAVEDGARARDHAAFAARLALTDQHVDDGVAAQALTVTCVSPGCSDGALSVHVEVPVELPLLGGLGLGSGLVTLEADRAVVASTAGEGA